ncbi:putative DNA binding domain-containing protein [Gordonia sp. PP30]|uniref:RNA-binding domain-containing protein n=1 Tax=unclassified Gordonia (in: high G+C Gram-positive bacteria) TaxID=2657482 RepID=UPI001FFE81C9|nr:RNA-binding domain-containing protein [Gordonia sp. PP30]UQE74740.1 putative DNA binding domain-containing protein [Gordonia sp. PP30]
MNADDLTALLDRLIADGESEVVEFKRGRDGFSANEIGRYFSALANEANLRAADAGWLVFGVDDKTRSVAGTTYGESASRLNALKLEINQNTDPRVSFRDVHVLESDAGSALLFEIPPAPRGLPISWKGHHWARAGESLVPLGLEKLDELRNQMISTDWTAAVIPHATLDHLDPGAIAQARRGFIERYPRLADEAVRWDDATFLEKVRLTQDGGVTRAAVVLLGKFTSAHLISPHMAEMTWKLTGEQEAFEHFSLPFLVNADKLISRIRNVQIRFNDPNHAVYREISKYDDDGLHEALYNCIAHQDYRRNARIVVTERPDRIEFLSVGDFVDRTPDDYMLADKVPREYRNPLLVAAMTELNLIDHMGNGIHRMVSQQRQRFLPLPDYHLDEPGEVTLTVYGAVIDKAYTDLLMVRDDLPLEDVLALDRVQKSLPISVDAVKRLRKANLVEGRKPYLTVSARIADLTGRRAEYSRARALDDEHYAQLIIDYLDKFQSASRREIDALLWDKLPDTFSDGRKDSKIHNLLVKLRKRGVIRSVGSTRAAKWQLDSTQKTET